MKIWLTPAARMIALLALVPVILSGAAAEGKVTVKDEFAKDNPKWKAISDAKKNVRNEKAPVIADALVAR